MAKILEEGPIRRMLREKGITKHRAPITKGELMGRLMSVMEEYGAGQAAKIPMECDILAKELTRVFELSSEEHIALREKCIQRARR